jgi:hypothetical protein
MKKINPMILLGVIGIVVIFSILLVLPTEQEDAMDQLPSSHALTPESNKQNESQGITEVSMNLSSDSYEYEEADEMLLTITINSPRDYEDVEIKIRGVENKYGSERVKEEEEFDIKKGLNEIEMEAELPNCSSCSGISPGEYNVTATLDLGEDGEYSSTIRILLKDD